MVDSKKRLGRGMESLVSTSRFEELRRGETDSRALGMGTATRRQYVAELPIDKISANPHQPRRDWDEPKLQELAASIRSSGLIHPVVVRPMGGGFQLVAGERRLRAARLAGQTAIPAIVRDASEDQMLEWALVENIQRADLNPVERARAYRHYIDQCSVTQQEAAERLGQDRATIANYMRLLELPEIIRDMLAGGRLSMGHARALLAVSGEHVQVRLAERVVAENLSVRRLEGLVRAEVAGPVERRAPQRSPHIEELEREMTQSLGLRVRIRSTGSKGHRGAIVIEFHSLDDFDRVRGRLFGKSAGLRPGQ